ncbi:hypothetical protein IBTHAUMO2_570008 [Nitrosopumilaceae archaeon]|nr:hypothetical protein [Alphaproteobacteria bacterium]CAI9832052.1 hypothetical protein IBTHAUMO2_570008 [Nitrosopumilaceae archaeon]
MPEKPLRDWTDAEGWSEDQLRWTPEDTKIMERSLNSGPHRATTYEEIVSKVGLLVKG